MRDLVDCEDVIGVEENLCVGYFKIEKIQRANGLIIN